jgi:hypothetical protein
MVGDGVLDNLQQFLVGVDGSDGETMKQLDHETSKSLECTWDSDGRAYFDQDTFGGVDVDLKLSSLVDRGVEEGKETLQIVSIITMLNRNVTNLMGDIWSSVADVAIHLAHDSNVLVTVQERVFLLALSAWSATTVASLVCLETGIGEDDDQSLSVFVGGRNRNVLFSDKLWKRRWREGLSS